jgi:Txe/YoeB family toxin of Txe-Axe toxin-antitoxin module
VTKSGSASNPPLYRGVYAQEFSDQLVSRDFRSKASQIQQKCKQILQAPYTACRSERLKHESRGQRSAQIDRLLRVIYTICEECRTQGDMEFNQLDCCAEEDADLTRVTFLTITKHYRT